MKKPYVRFLRPIINNKGQGLVEYALILLLIAIVVILALKMLGGQLNSTYENIDSGVTNAGFK